MKKRKLLEINSIKCWTGITVKGIIPETVYYGDSYGDYTDVIYSKIAKEACGNTVMKIGSRNFDIQHHTYVMGILNVTPDSFSDGGKFLTVDAAMKHVEKMVVDGADIIDVGGESTRPGFQEVSAEEELERVMPVIRGIKKNFDIPVSLDTWKSDVAILAVKEGVDLINDISCMKDIKMPAVIAENGCAYCLMHNREGQLSDGNLLPEIMTDLRGALDRADAAGIKREQMMIDPGIGFAKSYKQNLLVLNRLEEFHCFGLPILLGVSRKSVIGMTLDVPVEKRLEGTLATTVYGVMKHCAFVRVHDVKENVRAVRMAEAILNCADE